MLEYQISKFARDCLEKQKLSPPAKILDAPCGYGRHAHWLAELGHNVYAIDIDSKRVKYARNTAPPKLRPINWIVGDIEKPTFGHTTTFDLVLVIHYYSEGVIRWAQEILKPGGSLILETFGGHGQNWLALPTPGRVSDLLTGGFNIVSLTERKVGPLKQSSVVKVLATRR